MKRSHTSKTRKIELVCTVVLVIISVYCGIVLALEPNIRRFRSAYSAGSRRRIEIRPAAVTCDLPDGWQADWRGELLWITHYNSNGTVADALPFNGLEDLYCWIETHPDFCDVDVEKFRLPEPDAAEGITTTELESTISIARDSGK